MADKFEKIGEIVLENGKTLFVTAYRDVFGEIKLPEGLQEKLSGLPLEEQIGHFRITESACLARDFYGEGESERVFERSYSLQNYEHVKGLVIRGDILVGIVMQGYFSGLKVLLPSEGTCVYYASDNNGGGYKEREDYAYLICM